MRITFVLLALSFVSTSALAQPAVVPDAAAAADAAAATDAGPPADVKTPDAAPAADAGAAKNPTATEPAAEIKPPYEMPEDMSDAIKDVGVLIEAARNGNWVFFSGLLIMLIIWILDKVVDLKKRIPAGAVPWVAATFGIIASIAAQLTTGIPWGQALLQGFTGGVTAVGLWELIFKHVSKKDEPKEA